jgi:hypothetical protein
MDRIPWTHALVRSVLLGSEGARRRRRPVDPAHHQGAAPPGTVPVYRPEAGAAGHRHQPALRSPSRAGVSRPDQAGGSRAAGGHDPVPPHRRRRRARAGAQRPRRLGHPVYDRPGRRRGVPESLVCLPRLGLPARPGPRRPGGVDRAPHRRPPGCHRGIRRLGPDQDRPGGPPGSGPERIPAAHPGPAVRLPARGPGPGPRRDDHRRHRDPEPRPARTRTRTRTRPFISGRRAAPRGWRHRGPRRCAPP